MRQRWEDWINFVLGVWLFVSPWILGYLSVGAAAWNGLDHDRVLFGRYALPIMAHYVDKRGGHLADATERDRLLYWYFQSAMWGRFSGSTSTGTCKYPGKKEPFLPLFNRQSL